MQYLAVIVFFVALLGLGEAFTASGFASR